MPTTESTTCVPVRVKMRLQAAILWALLSIPSIVVTIVLYVSTYKSQEYKNNVSRNVVTNG